MFRVILFVIILQGLVLGQDVYGVCDNEDLDKYEDIRADEGDILFEVWI